MEKNNCSEVSLSLTRGRPLRRKAVTSSILIILTKHHLHGEAGPGAVRQTTDRYQPTNCRLLLGMRRTLGGGGATRGYVATRSCSGSAPVFFLSLLCIMYLYEALFRLGRGRWGWIRHTRIWSKRRCWKIPSFFSFGGDNNVYLLFFFFIRMTPVDNYVTLNYEVTGGGGTPLQFCFTFLFLIIYLIIFTWEEAGGCLRHTGLWSKGYVCLLKALDFFIFCFDAGDRWEENEFSLISFDSLFPPLRKKGTVPNNYYTTEHRLNTKRFIDEECENGKGNT